MENETAPAASAAASASAEAPPVAAPSVASSMSEVEGAKGEEECDMESVTSRQGVRKRLSGDFDGAAEDVGESKPKVKKTREGEGRQG